MKRLLPRISLAVYLSLFACLAGYGALLFSGQTVAQRAVPVREGRGAYLARLGDCTSCHTSQGHPDFAGGFKVNSPFGAIYGSNITPDPGAGIGHYTLEDFTRVLRQGVAKDGTHLYPAMPYTAYSKLSDEDIAALYDYFMHEVKPSSYVPPKTQLPFPFNQRWGLWFWNLAFAPDKRFQPDAGRDAAWNRGQYLVESLGHCSACHSPRGPAFEETASPRSRAYLSGEILDNWYAANLTGDKASGMGSWTEGDIVSFLKTGHGNGSVAFGSMGEVIENSTQHLTDSDATAIAHYLKSLPSHPDGAQYRPDDKPIPFELPGAGIYASSCAGCHGANGAGRPGAYPKLAGNGAVLSANPASLIRIVLEGGRSPQTVSGPRPEKMPAFANLTDREIAEVVSFLRQSWGNRAASVSERQVTTLRRKLKE